MDISDLECHIKRSGIKDDVSKFGRVLKISKDFNTFLYFKSLIISPYPLTSTANTHLRIFLLIPHDPSKETIYNSSFLSFSLTGKSQFDGNFDEISIGFFDFFEYYTDKSVIDLLLLDVEGTEFAIFKLIAGF